MFYAVQKKDISDDTWDNGEHNRSRQEQMLVGGPSESLAESREVRGKDRREPGSMSWLTCS
jgi:hypothetical protein